MYNKNVSEVMSMKYENDKDIFLKHLLKKIQKLSRMFPSVSIKQ